MAKKLSLKLKKKEPEAAAAPAAGMAAAPTAAPMFAAPASGTGGITLELRGANIEIAEVVIRPSSAEKKGKGKRKK